MKLFSGFFKKFSIDNSKVDTQTETDTKQVDTQTETDTKKIVELIEPNDGRVVTLQVFAEEPVLHMMISLITSDAQANISGNIITFTFPDDHLAELFRASWSD